MSTFTGYCSATKLAKRKSSLIGLIHLLSCLFCEVNQNELTLTLSEKPHHVGQLNWPVNLCKQGSRPLTSNVNWPLYFSTFLFQGLLHLFRLRYVGSYIAWSCYIILIHKTNY